MGELAHWGMGHESNWQVLGKSFTGNILNYRTSSNAVLQQKRKEYADVTRGSRLALCRGWGLSCLQGVGTL